MIRGISAICRYATARCAFQALLLSVLVLFVVAGILQYLSGRETVRRRCCCPLGKKVITKKDLDERISAYPPEVRANLEKPEQRQQFLESLIQIQIVAAEAKEQNVHKKKIVATKIEDATNTVLLREIHQLEVVCPERTNGFGRGKILSGTQK